MAKLIFFDETHEYELNGEIIPCVGELSRFASREVYGEVNQYALDNACDRGKVVHKACELIDKYGECEITDDIEQYVKAYMQFRKDYHIKEFVAIEKAVASQEMKYAGTIDRVMVVDGKLAIVDLKSSCVIQKVLAMIQLNGYKMLYEENNPTQKIEALYILHLVKDGTYKLVPFEIDNTLFMACYNLHKALEKKKRTKKIKTEEQNNG
ncbi:MAG: DUF2800 domain-containing protein [Clostridia bacterium]